MSRASFNSITNTFEDSDGSEDKLKIQVKKHIRIKKPSIKFNQITKDAEECKKNSGFEVLSITGKI